jgi:iron complex transport system ATP-binding protein
MGSFKQYANSFQAKSRLGLESIGRLCEKCGNPQKNLRFIHVAGTNGKGSVCAFLSCILADSGLKTGKFISPNMIDVCERISIDGKNISDMSAVERAHCVAYIPQAANPAFSYSVADMVLMGTMPQLSGRLSPGNAEKEIAMDALARLGIEDLAMRSYSQISGGEQQLVIIARAIAQGARILIMDEPTSSLDYGNQMRVQKQLTKLIEDGYTIIQSSHNPEQAYVFADRIICIRGGRIYRQGRPEEVLDEQLIRDLYNIDVEMISSGNDKARFFILKQ